MKADPLNAKDLFGKNVRYVIPTFQRPYVWNKADQWEPLWEDVEHAAERYIEALVVAGDNYAQAEELAGRHFLGAIVVQQELTGSTEIETRNVIDGQQRLTTIQLLIDAAQEVEGTAGKMKATEIADRLTDVLGVEGVSVSNLDRYAVDGMIPSAVASPATVDETARVVRMAAREGVALVVRGSRA